ncbi:MAG TPA: RidA family protein [Acidimicrobiia bacterium]|nr:RidA family protein [Acidimicrobiia bacterium]
MTTFHDRDAAFAALDPLLSAAPGPDTTVRAAIRHDRLLFLSGQVAFRGSELLAVGRLGDDVDVATGQACARQCAVNLLGRTQELIGSLADVEQVVKLTVFVASAPGFREQHVVANGASQVFRDVLGEAGTHARSAVGMAELPLGTPVEVEAIMAVR